MQIFFQLLHEDCKLPLELTEVSSHEPIQAADEQGVGSCIYKLFGYVACVTVDCNSDICKYKSNVNGSNIFMNIVIPSNCRNFSLVSCIDFTFKESLNGTCQSCSRKNSATTTNSIISLGNIIILQLKRYYLDDNGNVNKINKVVDFPLKGLDFVKQGMGKEFIYDLYAVIEHVGVDPKSMLTKYYLHMFF